MTFNLRYNVLDEWQREQRSCKIKFDNAYKGHIRDFNNSLTPNQRFELAEINSLFQDLHRAWKEDIQIFNLKNVPVKLLSEAVDLATLELNLVSKILFDYFGQSPNSYNSQNFINKLKELHRVALKVRNKINRKINKFLLPYERLRSIRFC